MVWLDAMLTPAVVRRLVADLPHVEDKSTDASLAFEVAGRGFAWSWKERLDPKTPRVPNLAVLAVRVPAEFRAVIRDAHPDRYEADAHYANFPALLVRLDRIDEAELQAMLEAAWRCVAPRGLVTSAGSRSA